MLVREGFAGRGIDAREAVRAWQREDNRRAAEEHRINEDGRGGLEVAAASGVSLAA